MQNSLNYTVADIDQKKFIHIVILKYFIIRTHSHHRPSKCSFWPGTPRHKGSKLRWGALRPWWPNPQCLGTCTSRKGFFLRNRPRPNRTANPDPSFFLSSSIENMIYNYIKIREYIIIYNYTSWNNQECSKVCSEKTHSILSLKSYW